jgi:hypothetical protein
MSRSLSGGILRNPRSCTRPTIELPCQPLTRTADLLQRPPSTPATARSATVNCYAAKPEDLKMVPLSVGFSDDAEPASISVAFYRFAVQLFDYHIRLARVPSQ